MRAVDPRNLSVVEWCDRMASSLSDEVAPFRLDREEDWQDWGAHSIQLLSRKCRGIVFPNPYQFEDWRDWAERFVQAVRECSP